MQEKSVPIASEKLSIHRSFNREIVEQTAASTHVNGYFKIIYIQKKKKKLYVKKSSFKTQSLFICS